MIEGLKPYPRMKDSGVPWLGRVPEHWDLRRMKTVLHERVEKGFPEEPLLAATQTKGVVRKERYETRTVVAMKDLHLLKLVRPGDFVISLRSFQGGIEYAREQGIISPAYTILESRDADSHGYLARLFKSSRYIENLSLFVTGIRQGQNIDYEMLARDRIPIPSSSEQAAIAKVLTHADRRIRRLIRSKQKLVTLLEEQKQAIIHRAVTRGLDSSIRLKPSGIGWVGSIPSHWQATTLGRVITRAVDGPHHSPTYHDSGIPFLSARNIKADRWSLDDVKYISAEDFAVFSRRVTPEFGDVLYTKGGTTGVARAVDLNFRFQVWVHVAVLKVMTHRILPEYLATVLNSPRCYEQSQLFTRGATNQDLGLGRMKGIAFALPPVEEQRGLLNAIGAETSPLTTGIERAQREIDLLKEFRTRLISDVVTGKLDVREAAARLPAEAAEGDDPFDDTTPDGEEDDDSSVESVPEDGDGG